MKKMRLMAALAIAFLLSLFAACSVPVGSSESSRGFALGENATLVWLDRYDEADVELAEGNAAELIWTSADETIVTVENGRLVAQGKGETTVTVSDGSHTETITVKVRDSGVKPTIGFEAFDAYLNAETEIPQTIGYNGKKYEASLDYSVEIADETVATFENGKIKGLQLGETSASLSAQYKGLTLEKEVTVTVKPALYISFGQESVELYNVDGKLGSAAFSAEVVELGRTLENAEIVYKVTQGAECVSLGDGEISAVAEGTAVLEASYTREGESVTASLTITVHPNYIETYFKNVSSQGIVWRPYGDPVDGRTGDIYEYRAGESLTSETCWEHHISEARSGESVMELYREGARYFAYDLYYTSNQNLMVGCGATTSWISVGDYFRKDYLKILADGEVINRLDKNRWVTVVYDLRALWMNNMGLSSYFFFFVNDNTTTQYIMNARFYLDDSFIPDENLVYEDKGDYVQATNDEFDVLIPVSKGYKVGEETPSVVVGEGEAPSYGPYNGEIGGRTGVYKYATYVNGGMKNSLVVASSMNDTYDDSYYRMSQLGSYLTFDIYPAQGGKLIFRMNYDHESATVEVGKTNLGEFEGWLIVIKDGKKQSVITANEWQTVCIAFADNYTEDLYSAFISFSAERADSVVYVDNVRYWKEGGFIPEEYAEENIGPYVKTDAAGVSEYVSLEKIMSGSFKGAYKYENGTSGSDEGNGQNWGESGVYFKQVTEADDTAGSFFAEGYKFVRFELYISDNVRSLSIRSTADRNYENYWVQDIVIGEAFGDKAVYAFNADGTSAGLFERDTWYTVYIPVGYLSSDVGTVYVCVYSNGGSASAPATMYLRYVSFEYAVNTPFLRENISGVSEFISLGYETTGEYAGSWRYENGTSGSAEGNGQNWGESGVRFSRVTASDDGASGAFFIEGYKWIKVNILVAENVNSLSIRVSGDMNLTMYWPQDVKIGQPFTQLMYVLDGDGKRAASIERNVWYTLYIPVDYVSADTGWTTVNIYTNGGSKEAPAVMYLKDIEYCKTVTIPDYEAEEGGEQVYPFAREDQSEWVTVTKQEDGSYVYVNKTSGTESGTQQNWGESGVFFAEIANGSFFTDGYKYIRMEIKVGENVNSLTLRFGSGTNNSYWIEEIKIGAGLPVGRGIYLYDADGKKAETLERGEWYTLYIPVNDAGAYNCLFTNGGSPEAPATVYLKNLSYTKNVNESSSYAYIKEGTLAEGTGDVAGSRKLEAGTEVFFSGVTHTSATSGEECTGAFFGDGYKYLAMDIYFGENATSISFNVVGDAFGSWTTAVYTFTVGEAIPGNFIFVDADGYRATSIAKNTWYKVYFRVDYTASSGWTEFKLTIEGGEIYVKNVEFYKEAPEVSEAPEVEQVYPFAREDQSEWVTVTKQEDGSYVYVNKTSGTESGTQQNWGESGVFFAEIANGSFFTDGYKYIRMEIKVGENVNSLTLRFGSGTNNSYWIEEIKIGAGLPVGRGIYLYDADGKKAETLERGEWYTLYIPVNDAGALNCLFTNGGSPEAPATVYLKNLSYTKNVNESSSYAYIKEGTLAEGTGDVAGSRKLEAGTEVFFSGVTHTSATSGEESTGAFFGDGYKYLAMDIYFGENTTSISFNVVGDAFGSWTTAVYTFTIGEAIPGNFIFVDADGYRATSIAKNTWYKVYFRVDYTAASGWTEFKLTIEGGEIYVKNVEFYKEAPEVSEAPEVEQVYPFAREDQSEWVTVTKQEDGSYVYVNKTSGTESGTQQNWGESGVFFAEIANGSFFTDGYKYIRMEIKVGENVNSLTLRFGSGTNNSYWIEEIKIGAGLPVGRGIYLYDADGKKAETLNRGEWYTLYIPVNDAGAYNCLFTNGGSPEAPATVYLKNLSYTKNVNESSSYAYIKEGTLAEGTGDVAGSRKLEAGTEVFFSGVTHSSATSGEESTGAFFGDGYKYLAMDIYFGENTTSISFNVVGDAFGGWTPAVYTFTVGEAIPENFIFVDADGYRATSIAKNTWYKVYFRVDYTAASGWTEFKLTIEGGEIYVKNVEFYKEVPAISES